MKLGLAGVVLSAVALGGWALAAPTAAITFRGQIQTFVAIVPDAGRFTLDLSLVSTGTTVGNIKARTNDPDGYTITVVSANANTGNGCTSTATSACFVDGNGWVPDEPNYTLKYPDGTTNVTEHLDGSPSLTWGCSIDANTTPHNANVIIAWGDLSTAGGTDKYEDTLTFTITANAVEPTCPAGTALAL